MANSVTAQQIRDKANAAELQGNRGLAEQLRNEAETQALNDVYGRGWRRDKHGVIQE